MGQNDLWQLCLGMQFGDSRNDYLWKQSCVRCRPSCLAVMFGWKVISAGVTIGVTGGVMTFGALPIG
eukprot:scaffold39147_cov55-Attheya_sp.AAC.2